VVKTTQPIESEQRQRDGRNILEGGKDHSTHRIGTATGSIRVTALMVYLINVMIALITVIIFEVNNQFLTLVTTIIFALIFLFFGENFGEKLDSIPIIITQNQLRKKQKSLSYLVLIFHIKPLLKLTGIKILNQQLNNLMILSYRKAIQH